MNYRIFKITNWYVQVGHIAKTYKEVEAFLTNPDLVDQHLDIKIDKINAIENAEVAWNEENTQLFKEMHGHSLPRALEFYKRQVVVNISTYIELVLKEFLPLVFMKFPQRMFLYVNSQEDFKGYVNVKIIIEASSLDELLKNLSEQATINALSGGTFKKHLKRLEKVTQKEIPSRLKDNLIKVIQQRNRIVHEGSKEDIGLDKIKEAVESYIDFLIFLNKVANESGINVDNDLTGDDFKRLEWDALWL